MKYSTLFFDADGTLYDFKKTEQIALENFYGKRDLDCSFTDFLTVYERENRLLWEALERGEVTPGQVKTDRFINTMTVLGIYRGDGEEMSRDFMNELAGGKFLIPGAEKLIEMLAPRYGLYIITNGLWDVQRRRLGESEIFKKYFQGLIVSEKAGAAKPAAVIFDEAFRVAGNPPKEKVLIIGDSLTSDIRGGDLYGIDTCWYNPAGLEQTGPSVPTYTVSDYDEIAAILMPD